MQVPGQARPLVECPTLTKTSTYLTHPACPAEASTPCGTAVGGCNLHSLTQLMAGRQRGSPFAALALSMPALNLPRDLQHLAEQRDDRIQHPHARVQPAQAGRRPNGSAAQEQEGPSLQMRDLTQIASLTPGVNDTALECLAESIVLRGGVVRSLPQCWLRGWS